MTSYAKLRELKVTWILKKGLCIVVVEEKKIQPIKVCIKEENNPKLTTQKIITINICKNEHLVRSITMNSRR